jgi:hypothetical protein
MDVQNGDDGRRVKGVNLIGLVRMCKVYRRQQPLAGLSAETLALIDERILVSSWYPLVAHLEILDFAYRHMMAASPDNAIAMGLAGGKEIWTTAHRGVVGERDSIGALRSMGPAWHAYFDFGSLDVEIVDERTARFTVKGYPDVPVSHGMTIAGWHLAAAHVTGHPKAKVEVLARPWDGADGEQVHVVRW